MKNNNRMVDLEIVNMYNMIKIFYIESNAKLNTVSFFMSIRFPFVRFSTSSINCVSSFLFFYSFIEML